MKKEKKQKKNKAAGYVPFSKKDINLNDGRNTKAEELFLQMLDIPEKVAKKKRKGKDDNIVDDDFYPRSMDETVKMENMIKQVEAAIDDRSDKEFIENVSFMKDVITWSKKRHWTFSWIIAICVFGVSLYCRYQANDYGDQAKSIEKWTQEQTVEKQNAEINQYETWVAEYTQRADTASTKSDKKYYLNTVEKYQEKLKEINVSWKDYQKLSAKIPQKEANGWRFWQCLWLAMIVLYVIAERPYGYMITNRRIEAAILGGIKKIGFALAGGLVGMAGALQFTEVIVTRGDGSRTREDDGSGPAIIAMKVILLALAAIVVGVVSCAIITYSVVMGFLRNYELIPIIKKALKKKDNNNLPKN